MANVESYRMEAYSFLAPLAVLSLVYAATRRHINPLASYFYRIVEPRLFCAATVFLNSMTFSCLLDCPALDFLRTAIFGYSLTVLDLWSCFWMLLDYWNSVELIRALIPSTFLRKTKPSTRLLFHHIFLLLTTGQTFATRSKTH